MRRDGPDSARVELGGWLLVLLLAFAFLGTRALYDPDEGRYVGAAREMILSGDWILPTIGERPHLTKPPLTYWAIASGLGLFGFGEWAARLYLALALIACAWATGALGEALLGARRGRLAGPAYALMLLPFVAASVTTTDALLVAFTTLAMLAAWRAMSAKSAGASRRAAWCFWLALGLGFLTKGPAALLPLLVLALFGALLAPGARPAAPEDARGGEPRPLRRWAWARVEGPLLFLLVVAPWFLLIEARYAGALSYLLNDEVLARVASDAHRRNAEWHKILEIYGPVLVLGALPWWPLWIVFARRARRRSGPASARAAAKTSRRARLRARLERLCRQPAALLIAVWTLPTALLFALLPSRQFFYLAPIFPALALLTLLLAERAGVFAENASRPSLRRFSLLGLGLWVAFLLGLRVAGGLVDHQRDAERFARFVAPFVEPEPSELFLVDARAFGLGFYLDMPLRRLDLDGMEPPALWDVRSVDEQLARLERAAYPQVFISWRGSAERLGWRLARAGHACSSHWGRERFALFRCEPRTEPPARERIALVVDAARDGRERRHLLRLLRRLDGEWGLDEVLVARAAPPRPAGLRLSHSGSLVRMAWPLAERGVGIHELGELGALGADRGGGSGVAGTSADAMARDDERTLSLRAAKGGGALLEMRSENPLNEPERARGPGPAAPWRALLGRAGFVEAKGVDIALLLREGAGAEGVALELLRLSERARKAPLLHFEERGVDQAARAESARPTRVAARGEGASDAPATESSRARDAPGVGDARGERVERLRGSGVLLVELEGRAPRLAWYPLGEEEGGAPRHAPPGLEEARRDESAAGSEHPLAMTPAPTNAP